MNIFEAKQVEFDCQECPGKMKAKVAPNKDSDIGFDIIEIRCQQCGAEVDVSEFSAAELLGL
ncbi:hypothetical protein FV139_20575 [Parahaliea maris]|uniref:Uncharacterized protein n=1 Tax=Parahaliea maris TaxID=2716870 RepID=A0A5C8ZKJ9_9GAMM|nr:hypothetical protein [Parahaliea maris]TXS89076.1 hypothetical protein FV139_20575 [Parahaliea maris]